MDDLTAFVTARLDEDEQLAARGWSPVIVTSSVDVGPPEGHMQMTAPVYGLAWDPDRLRREVAAKRAILKRHSVELVAGRIKSCAYCQMESGWVSWPCDDVLGIAAIWSDHPDYNPKWAPDT